jgi:type II secretory pathway pseudopilin PulG
MTLSEVVVGLALFAMVATGLGASLLQARRLAENNIYRISALVAAQGFLEQLKSMAYEDLALNPIPTQINQGQLDPIIPGEWNLKLIDIHETPNNPQDDMRFWVRPTINELTSVNGYRAYEIILDYRWEFLEAGGRRNFESSIRVIRSLVPNF